MISFNYETNFNLNSEKDYADWITRLILFHQCDFDEINYIFCDDEYLHRINVEFLQHDTYTDIITFDNSLGNTLISDIFISIERVKENAESYDVSFDNELKRVMSHGVLHLIGFMDKSDTDKKEMRLKEEEAINMFHVEQ
ncbi:MAG: rRNA maturation RNase YbeY [Flavobacteriaceae bacterium]|nr:rRNA maturation RNase YbeY [Flavobacteriaceae bacterium]